MAHIFNPFSSVSSTISLFFNSLLMRSNSRSSFIFTASSKPGAGNSIPSAPRGRLILFASSSVNTRPISPPKEPAAWPRRAWFVSRIPRETFDAVSQFRHARLAHTTLNRLPQRGNIHIAKSGHRGVRREKIQTSQRVRFLAQHVPEQAVALPFLVMQDELGPMQLGRNLHAATEPTPVRFSNPLLATPLARRSKTWLIFSCSGSETSGRLRMKSLMR
jgi:hypothetical protein